MSIEGHESTSVGQFSMQSTSAAVPRKNVVWAFKSCQISLDKMLIFEASYEYFHLKFSGSSGEIASKITRSLGKKIFISSPGNSCFIKWNLATPGGSYGAAFSLARQMFYTKKSVSFLSCFFIEEFSYSLATYENFLLEQCPCRSGLRWRKKPKSSVPMN